MGLTSQRLHRRKLAERQGRTASPAVHQPALIPRVQHERALQELTRSHEQKLSQAEARIVELEESNARLAGALAEPDEAGKSKAGKSKAGK